MRNKVIFQCSALWLLLTATSWVKGIFGGLNLATTYTYESPSYDFLQSGIDAGLTNGAPSGVFVNSGGVAGTGSGVTPLTNSSGQTVAYLANNPNAQYIAAAYGIYWNGGRAMLEMQPIDNFDVALFKKFTIKDRFGIEFHGEAYNWPTIRSSRSRTSTTSA